MFKINILTCVVRKKNSERNKKTITPPPPPPPPPPPLQVKWSVPKQNKIKNIYKSFVRKNNTILQYIST